MNFYQHHLGDYAAATGHLSALEHGIYRLLLDWYYANERPIPDAMAHRYARADRKDVEPILAEFFTRDGDVWRHGRVEREIAEYHERCEHNRRVGKLGGRPKKSTGNPVGSKQEPEQNPDGFQNEPGRNRPGPLTNNHEPISSVSTNVDTGASAPDPIWGAGLAFLIRKGIPERPARSLLGKLRKAAGDVRTGALLAQAETDDVTDPAAWLMASAVAARDGPRQSLQAQVKAANRAAIERMKNGGSDVVPSGNRGRSGQLLGDWSGESAGLRLARAHDPDVD